LKRVFSTADVMSADRFDYWHQVACQTIVDHHSIPQCRENFGADINVGSLAELPLVVFETSSMSVFRTAQHIRRARHDDIFGCLQLSGELLLEQEGRETRLQPGDLTLLDPMLPYTGQFFDGSRLLVLKVPRRSLEARIGKTRSLVCRGIKPVASEHRLASNFIALLPAQAEGLSPAASELIKEQTVDLLGLSLAKLTQNLPRISGGRMLVLFNIRAAIEARLCDPSLDPASVAAAAGVSVRYANSILADDNQSIGRVILERRLARCRRSLEDPHQSHRSISEIAYGWGFSNMTYFGRMFRNAYGLPPRDFRRQFKSRDLPPSRSAT
jgi:AraC family transcriptional activator of tynA and feaB